MLIMIFQESDEVNGVIAKKKDKKMDALEGTFQKLEKVVFKFIFWLIYVRHYRYS